MQNMYRKHNLDEKYYSGEIDKLTNKNRLIIFELLLEKNLKELSKAIDDLIIT